MNKGTDRDAGAPAQALLLPAIAERWSPYAFSPRRVEPEKLRAVMEAARRAASSGNTQPWSFVVAERRNADQFETLLQPLVPANREWVEHAAVVGYSAARTTFEQTGQPNRHAFHDTGMALASLMIQATHLGLHVHPMAGFDVEKARLAMALPESWEPVAAFALGYLGNTADLPERLRPRDATRRPRKPLEAFVFEGTWNRPADFAAGV